LFQFLIGFRAGKRFVFLCVMKDPVSLGVFRLRICASVQERRDDCKILIILKQ
jgi:hypothetical protein